MAAMNDENPEDDEYRLIEEGKIYAASADVGHQRIERPEAPWTKKARGWFPVVCVSFVLSWCYWIYVMEHCKPLMTTDVKHEFWEGFIEMVVLSILMWLGTWSYLTVIVTDPGRIGIMMESPILRAKLSQESMIEMNKKEIKECEASKCLICNIYKPPRAHHCSTCNECILVYDHHCPWVNNCVGQANKKAFHLTLLYLTLSCVFVFSTAHQRVIDRDCTDEQPLWGHKGHSYCIHNVTWTLTFLIFVTALIGMFLGLLGFANFLMLIYNDTPVERKRRPRTRINAHDEGCWENVKFVFGPHVWCWPFPINVGMFSPLPRKQAILSYHIRI